MNTTKQDVLRQRYKICAARDCPNQGIYRMEILYLGRDGWFCEHCKKNLVTDGLLVHHHQQQAVTNG
jgi:hypothetical protein